MEVPVWRKARVCVPNSECVQVSERRGARPRTGGMCGTFFSRKTEGISHPLDVDGVCGALSVSKGTIGVRVCVEMASQGGCLSGQWKLVIGLLVLKVRAEPGVMVH